MPFVRGDQDGQGQASLDDPQEPGWRSTSGAAEWAQPTGAASSVRAGHPVRSAWCRRPDGDHGAAGSAPRRNQAGRAQVAVASAYTLPSQGLKPKTCRPGLSLPQTTRPALPATKYKHRLGHMSGARGLATAAGRCRRPQRCTGPGRPTAQPDSRCCKALYQREERISPLRATGVRRRPARLAVRAGHSKLVGASSTRGIKLATVDGNQRAVDALMRAQAARGSIRAGMAPGEAALRRYKAVNDAIDAVPKSIRGEVAIAAGICSAEVPAGAPHPLLQRVQPGPELRTPVVRPCHSRAQAASLPVRQAPADRPSMERRGEGREQDGPALRRRRRRPRLPDHRESE